MREVVAGVAVAVVAAAVVAQVDTEGGDLLGFSLSITERELLS